MSAILQHVVAYEACVDGKRQGLYTGELVDGNRHGYGQMDYDSGATYDGEWRDNWRHGRGKRTLDGNWIRGHFTGYGTWTDGSDTYVGDFVKYKKQMRHGR